MYETESWGKLLTNNELDDLKSLSPNELERQLKKYGVRFVEKTQEVCKKAKGTKAMPEIEFRGKRVVLLLMV